MNSRIQYILYQEVHFNNIFIYLYIFIYIEKKNKCLFCKQEPKDECQERIISMKVLILQDYHQKT